MSTPDPSNAYFAITPSDLITSNREFRGLFLGGGGNVSIVDARGNTQLFKNCVAGVPLGLGGIRVNATGTTATDIVGLY